MLAQSQALTRGASLRGLPVSSKLRAPPAQPPVEHRERSRRASGTMGPWVPASPTASPPSPSPPRSPSTPRPRRSRPPAVRSSGSAPASRTSRRRTTSSRRPSPPRATRRTTSTPRSPGCRSCGRRSPPRPGATPATRSRPRRCWSPTAASRPSTTPSPTLLDPGDEVLLIAPYWTTYPECIKLAGGVPVEVVTDETIGLPRHPRPARGRAHRPHQGAAVRLAVQPDRRGLPARAGRGDRRVGPRERPVGGHRRDLRAPGLRRRRDGRRSRTAPARRSSYSTASPRPTP